MEKAGSRGRPANMPPEEVQEIILKYAEKIIVDGRVTSKDDPIWEQMAVDSNGRKKAKGFYSHVADNRNNIKSLLTGNCVNVGFDATESFEMSATNELSSVQDNSAISQSDVNLSVESEDRIVTIHFSNREFSDLLEEKAYNRTENDRPQQKTRCYTVFRPNEWQQVVTEKLWEKKVQHGFQFKTHKISFLSHTAYFEGTCKCGSRIRGTFEDITSDRIEVECRISPGKENASCGKRYCRAPEREAIGKMLTDQHKAVSVYRAERADVLMETGDPEPPHLYNANVIRVVKQQYKQSKREHKNVASALEILQLGKLSDIIHGYGNNPFYLHYWTHHQLDSYRTYCKNVQAVCILLDASGGLILPLVRIDKSKTKVIYLYVCVIHTGTGQFSVAQMITEAHNTNSIQFWLMEWKRSGAPSPREVVCDSSIALLSAAIRCFTGYLSIDEYADGCTEASVPKCYIRIDVAHFLKMYADFLKGVRPRIKRFFLAAVGQIILAQSKEEAGQRLTWLLTVARSETEGHCGPCETLCENRKRSLQRLITGCCLDDTIEPIIDSIERADAQIIESGDGKRTAAKVASDTRNDATGVTAQTGIDARRDDGKVELPDMQATISVADDPSPPNSWKLWGKNIDDSVKAAIRDQTGDRENAHFLPRFADRLVSDVKWLPLWSCVCRNTFGYGRVPASSASVESEFNNLKNRVLRNEELLMRADDFVKLHVQYLSGSTKINDAALKSQTAAVETSSQFVANSKATQPVAAAPVTESAGKPESISPFQDRVCEDEYLESSEYSNRHGEILPSEASTFQDELPAPLFPSENACIDAEESTTEEIPNRDDTVDRREKLDLPLTEVAGRVPLATSSMLNRLPRKRRPPQIVENKAVPAICVACANGDTPSNAHKCIFCRKAVHIFPGCSEPAPGQEEGYGQKRICVSCHKHHLESVAENIISNEKENWRGLANKTPKRARYLHPNFVEHELLLHEKLVNVPILKNGNKLNLLPVSLNKRKVTLSNTCPFDSLFQIFLSASLDSEKFFEYCGDSSNDFLKFVSKVAKAGINAWTYRERARILSQHCEVSVSRGGVDLIACQLTVGGLCCMLFRNESSFTEIVRCPEGCPERKVFLPRIQIERRHLNGAMEFTKAIEASVQLGDRPCVTPDCTSKNSAIIEPGNFILIEISIEELDATSKIRLQDLPDTLNLSSSDEPYRLVGTVEFKPPLMARRSSTGSDEVGHYTAISYRRDHSWVQYDDNKSHERILSSKTETLIELLLYVRGKKAKEQ